MKLKSKAIAKSPFFLRSSFCLASTLLACVDASGASATWLNPPANSNWADGANWTGGIAPGATTGTANADTATFGTSSLTAVTADVGRNIQNITFAANITYTLSGAEILLSSGGTILSNGSAGDERISAALQIQGNGGIYTIQTDTPGTNRELQLSGGISGTATAGNTTVLTLTGSSAGVNEVLTASISDGIGGGALAVVKDGAGLWIFGTANPYSGGTTVKAGTLRLSGSGDTTGLIGAGTLTFEGTGTLRLQSTTSTTVNNNVVVNGTGGTVSVRNNNFNPASLTGTGVLTLAADAGTLITSTNFRDFAGTVKVGTGLVTNSLRLGAGSVAFNESSLQNAVLDLQPLASVNHGTGTNGTLNTQIGTLAGAPGSFIGGSAAGNGTFVLTVGGRGESSTFSGAIVNGGTKTGLTKVGGGTLTLDGPNTYTGNTTVTGGVLSITTPYLADTSAVSIATDAKLGLNFTGSDAVATLTLGGTLVGPGTYSANTPTLGIFFSGNGSLVVGGGGTESYNTWATGFGLQNPWLGADPALNGEPTGDPDMDGQANSIEFTLGGSPVSGSNNAKIYTLKADTNADTLNELLLTIAVRDGTPAFSNTSSPSVSFEGFTYAIQGSTSLESFATAVSVVATVTADSNMTLPAPPAGYNYRTFSLSGSNGLAGKGFMRVVITRP